MTEASVLLRHKSYTLFWFSIALFCLCSALAPRSSAQLLNSALSCLNNKFIYNRCNRAYRLNESGELYVPPEATDEFCNGACLSETSGLLKCINGLVSNFIFRNGASVFDIRSMLNGSCSSSTRRRNFNVGDYMGSEISSSFMLPKQTSLCAILLMAVGWVLLIL